MEPKSFFKSIPMRKWSSWIKRPRLAVLERLYPGRYSNDLLGTFEYPDLPLIPGDFPVHQGQNIPGEVLHNYIVKYTKRHRFGKFIRFNTRVTKASTTTKQVTGHSTRRRQMKERG